MIARLVRRLARILVARPILVLAMTAAASAAALVPATRLTIRSDVLALLPDGAPAAEAYRSFLRSFGGVEKVFVVIRLGPGRAADVERLADAAETLAREISSSTEVAHVRWGLDEADEVFFTEFLARKLPLLVGDDPAAALAPRLEPAAIEARAHEIKDAASGPAAFFLTRLAASDPLGLAEGKLRELAAGGMLPFDPITGALLSEDGTAALVLVTPRRGEADPEGGRALEAALDAAFERTRAGLGPGLTFEAVGGPLYAAHDERALRADLIRILTAASILVVLLIVMAFDGLSIPAISIATVAVGQLFCAALVATVWGPVTAVGVGFAAILLGLGDDFTVHLGARVRSAWLSGSSPELAVEGAIVETAPGVVAAAVTTAAAFGCLGLAHFRPLRELGIVVACGVMLLLAATALVAAPLLTLAARGWQRRNERPPWRGFGWIVEAGIRAGERQPRTVLLAAGGLTILAALGIGRLELDTDLRRLRPEDHPSLRAERLLAESFAVPLDTATVTVPGRDAEEALDRAGEVANLLRKSLPAAAEITSPSDWIVTGSRLSRRLAALAPLRLDRAADQLTRALDDAGLRPEAFAPSLTAMREVAAGRDPAPLALAGYPEWLRDGVRTADGGAVVAVRARVPAGAWPQGPPLPVLEALQRVAPGAEVASAPALGAELKAVALSDVRRLGILALAVVFALVLISYRGDVRAAALTFVPVLLGMAWTAGTWGWLGRPLDLFTMCVLPVLVGIGIDDGLHVLHVARRTGGELAEAAREAGRGVVLTNLTTSAGFAALAVSHVPALRNGGLVVCVGNLLCLLATLVVLPAIAALRARR